MINEQVMMDTVARMLEAGIDDPTILSTLVDAGLAQEEASQIIQRVKTPQAQPSGPPAQQSSQDIQIMKNQIETQAQTQELSDTSVHNKLDAHEQKIDDVSKKLDEVKQAFSSAPVPQDTVLSSRISELELKLEEVSSISKATLDLLKKVLETDRKILTELEAKK